MADRTYVRVCFVNDDGSIPDVDYYVKKKDSGYTFEWTGGNRPGIGSILVTDTGSHVVVVGYKKTPGFDGEVKRISKLAPGDALTQAAQQRETRFDAADQVLAGKTVPGVPGTRGEADATLANQNGGWWWRTYKMAQEAGDPRAGKYRDVAEYWYAIRDNAESSPGGTRVIDIRTMTGSPQTRESAGVAAARAATAPKREVPHLGKAMRAFMVTVAIVLIVVGLLMLAVGQWVVAVVFAAAAVLFLARVQHNPDKKQPQGSSPDSRDHARQPGIEEES